MAFPIIIPDDVKAIALTNCDKSAIVDAEDYEFLTQWKWFITHQGYAARNQYISYINGKQNCDIILMHRVIMKTPKDMQTDHRDGNKLNNRKTNLRNCSHGQNQQNRGSNKFTTSKYKGVCWNKNAGKWMAEIMVNRKKIYLGIFAVETDAARAYNEASRKHHKEFGYINPL